MSFSSKFRALVLSALALSFVVSPVSVEAATKVLVKPLPKTTVQVVKPAAPLKKAPVTLPVKNNGTYINTNGNKVLRPYKAPAIPKGASAQCRDASYSFSQHRRGTCSGHGGVATWF